MKFRRGLLFALVQVLIALPLLLKLEASDAREVYRDAETDPRPLPAPPPPPPPAPSLDDPENGTETVTFDMCGGWVHYGLQQALMTSIHPAVMIVSGWRDICPARWTLAGHMVSRVWWRRHEEMLRRQRRLDMEVLGLIALEWFLVGSFPLIAPRRWWLEPGAFITLCAAIGCFFGMLPGIDALARLPALIALITWLVWMILLVALPFRLGWKWLCDRRARRVAQA
jgi:hypothetical protein